MKDKLIEPSVVKMPASRRVRVALCTSMVAIFLLYCLLLVHMPVVVVHSRNNHKLIVVLLEGLGRQQLNRLLETSDENAFVAMASHGVSADYLRPIFPTLTMPNHYAMMTGKYAENHGVVHDVLYDPQTEEQFRFDNRPALWLPNGATPLWLSVQHLGQRVDLSTTMCHKSVPVLNITATCPTAHTALDEQLAALANNLQKAFGTVALGDDVLAIVHTPLAHEVILEHGPDSAETEEVVERLDEILRGFLDDINGLESKVNLMVVSDVGLAPTSNKKPVSIDSALNTSLVAKMVGGGAHYGLWPKAGGENEVLEALSGLEGIRVQTKSLGHMLEKFHYRNHNMIAPVQILADDGFIIKPYKNAPSIGDKNNGFPKGMQGYDPFHVDDMKAIFYAQGPQFQTNFRTKFIHVPDVYGIMRTVLHMDHDCHHRHHDHTMTHEVLKKKGGHHH